MFDVWVALVFGVVGYLMRKFKFPMAPMVLASVLAQMLETSLSQSLVISQGSPVIENLLSKRLPVNHYPKEAYLNPHFHLKG